MAVGPLLSSNLCTKTKNMTNDAEQLSTFNVDQLQGLGLVVLSQAGFDPANLSQDDLERIQADPALQSAAVLAGVLPMKKLSADMLIDMAQKDPILFTEITDAARAECRYRGKMVAFCLMANDGLELEPQDATLLEELLLDSPVETLQIVLAASLCTSRKDLAEKRLRALKKCSDVERRWILEYACLYVMLDDDKTFAEAEEKVGAFFNDSLPLTLNRLFAWEQVREECRAGMRSASPVSRTLN